MLPSIGADGITGLDLNKWESKGGDRFTKALEDGIALSERAVSALAWLMSFNVELVESLE